MRTLIASLCLLAAVAPAAAANSMSRHDAATMTCAEVQQKIDDEGAVLVRFRSATNPSMHRFGRYVDSDRFCRLHNTKAFSTSIPTADTNSCAVKECQIWR